jgi:hypothetical protein
MNEFEEGSIIYKKLHEIDKSKSKNNTFKAGEILVSFQQ